MPLGAFFLLLLQVIKRKYQLLNKNIDYENNRTPMKITDVYIMKNVTIPTVIVECGFLSNSEETTLLKDDTYQYKLAWGIFLGIQEYFYNTSIVN